MEPKYNIEVVFDAEVKQEYEDGIEVKTECDFDIEIECKDIILEAEFTELFKDHILKDELVIGPELLENRTNDKYVKDIEHKKKNSRRKTKPEKTEWLCNLCNNKFRRKGALTKHMKYNCPLNLNKVLNNKWYTCDICNKQYGRRDILNRHKLIHARRKSDKFECHDCGNIYLTKDSIQRHVNVKHLNIKNDVACYLCHKKFNDKTYRNYHMEHFCPMNKSRSKCLPAKCDFCNKLLASKYSRITHMKTCPLNLHKHKREL